MRCGVKPMRIATPAKPVTKPISIVVVGRLRCQIHSMITL